MSETTEIILFMLSGVFICIGAGTAAFIKLLTNYSDLRERIVKMEVTLELIGRKSAKMLHSPHDPWGLDPMLDKYLSRHYEMSFEDWKELLGRCEVIAADEKIPKEERFIAAQLAAVCWHKLDMKPPQRKIIEKAANIAEDVTTLIVEK